MPNLLQAEREKYADIWSLESYAKHSPGERYAPMFRDMAMEHAAVLGTVLDAGCGSGKGAVALHKLGFEISCLCDFTNDGLCDEARTLPFVQACLWEPIGPRLPRECGGQVDWVYCCDVLEHIPTALTMLVVSRLLAVARQGVFLSICSVPDEQGYWIGRPLHLTVQPFVWWRDTLAAIGEVVEARDLLINGAFLVRAGANHAE